MDGPYQTPLPPSVPPPPPPTPPQPVTPTPPIEKPKSNLLRNIGIALLAIALLFLGIYLLFQKLFFKAKISSYEECIQAKGSLIQESYPAVCVAKDGRRFTQNLILPTPSPAAEEEESSQIKECYEKTSCEGPTPCMANPASVFCTCMGGELEIRENDQGQSGVCLIDGQEYDEWEYFRQMNPSPNPYTQ